MPLGWGWGLRMSSPRRVLHAIERLNRPVIPPCSRSTRGKSIRIRRAFACRPGSRFAHYFRLGGFGDRLRAILSGGRFGPIGAIAHGRRGIV